MSDEEQLEYMIHLKDTGSEDYDKETPNSRTIP
jgi:hypothetical protein